MVSIKLLIEGGNMKAGPAVAQQLGPLGINMGQVIDDVNEKTKNFKGMNVPIVLDINSSTKTYTINVKSPPTSELLKKEVSISKASGARLKLTVGNIAFERVLSVALQKHDNMLSNDILDSVKSVLGTCQAMGIIVDSKEVKDVFSDLSQGKYDAIIKAQKVDVDDDKSKSLKSFFDGLNKKQVAENTVATTEAAAKENAKPKEEKAKSKK